MVAFACVIYKRELVRCTTMTSRARCIIVTGRPGSGKTTLARELSKSLHMPMLSRDLIKEGYVSTFGVSHDRLPSDTNRRVTNLFFSTARSLLEGNVSVVVEAAFQHRVWQETIPAWSIAGDPCFIICEADPTLCAQRHLGRGLMDPTREFYHGDKRVKVFRETGEFRGPGDYSPPSFDLPTLRVVTTDGYSPELAAIRDFATGRP